MNTTTYTSVLTAQDHIEKAKNHATTLAKILLLSDFNVMVYALMSVSKTVWVAEIIDVKTKDCHEKINSDSEDVEMLWWSIDDRIQEVIKELDEHAE